jgi:hypothetical protein
MITVLEQILQDVLLDLLVMISWISEDIAKIGEDLMVVLILMKLIIKG